jgi:hypothetical protein
MRRGAVAAALLVLLAACSGTSAKARGAAVTGTGPPVVYAAIGGAETVGEGTDQPVRDSWPQLFFRAALPPTATFVNFGVPGVTVPTALLGEVPEALQVHPTLVTVWLNVDDLLRGVPVATYAAGLRSVVHDFRAAGATVLVADTPDVTALPVYAACAGAEGGCPDGVPTPLPPAAQLRSSAEAYNAAIAQVAREEGATVVDVRPAYARPGAVSDDGIDPSESATPVLAQEFVAALKVAAPADVAPSAAPPTAAPPTAAPPTAAPANAARLIPGGYRPSTAAPKAS